MISIHYIAQSNLNKTKASIESMIKAIGNAHMLCQCILVCAAPLPVCEYLLDGKILSLSKGMKNMTYVQASPEESLDTLIQRAEEIEKKLKTYPDITHNIIIDRPDVIKAFQISNLLKEIAQDRPADDPKSYLLFKDNKGGEKHGRSSRRKV